MSTTHTKDAASRVLIEDGHQGVTTPHAQQTIDRYREFVKEKDAPIAHMRYSPFTRHQTQGKQTQQPTQTSQNPLPSKSEFVLKEEVVPASSSQPTSGASSRAHSPSGRRSSTTGTTGPLEPSVLHTRVGGAAWSLEMPGWVKNSDSKRGSRVGSANASRKSSLTFGEPKNLALKPSVGGYETSQQIWAATTSDERVGAQPHSHRSFEKEQQVAADERLAEPQKRLSLNHPKPFLRAHATEQRIGVTQNSRFIGGGGKQKRASMPPLQNRRPSTSSTHTHSQPSHASTSSSKTSSRRSSLVTHATPAQPLRAAAMRGRSQSLPCDSLFLAYSSCALPAVMTSSLANMPIPSQPAIPVAVARRYSILSGSDMPHKAGSTVSDAEVLKDARDEEQVYIDPENVPGIDTSSTLDTSHLQDMAPLDEELDSDAEQGENSRFSGEEADEEDLAFALNQNNHTAGSGGKSRATSQFTTPMGSPVAEGEEISLDSYPISYTSSVNVPSHLSSATEVPVTTPPSSTAAGPSIRGHPASTPHRARSLINTSFRNGLNITAPTRDQISVDTPDYTPMTSPTNLSNAVFKQTLMTRRMSDVVARDISRKLKVLKKHMQQDSEEEKNSPA